MGCRRVSTPKPYGYYRITPPEVSYARYDTDARWGRLPYRFELSNNAVVRAHPKAGERYWIDIHYPQLNADIHCSYKPIEHNLGALTDDSFEFVYKHAAHAAAIPERAFSHPEADVYGLMFSLKGNTASPYQFFLTDSTRHFFRGAVYCNCAPNADSLAPVFEYLEHDIEHLIETFEWTR